MNEVPPVPAVPPAPAVPPVPGQRKSWVHSAALCSVGAPVVACAFGLLSSGPQTRMMKIALGGAGTAVILAGFILAIIALAGGLQQGRKGGKGLAIAGLAINGALLLGAVALIPALMRVARVRNAGYTVQEMLAMLQVIPGSRVILNEPLGFRIEIPGEFVDNPQPQPPQMLYSFLHTDMKDTVICINIERLGGWIRQEPLGSEYYAGVRSQMPPGTQIEHVRASWKTHQLDAFRAQFSMGGRVLCAWVVQVPLAREAIQVGVGGPAESGEECHQLLNQLLTGLQGCSNWDPPSARMTRATSSWPGPRVSHAVEPAAPAAPAPPNSSSADPIVAAGQSEVRTFPGVVPPIPERNSKLIYEFDLSLEPALIHVPAHYDGSTPFGLIVFLPGDGSFTEVPRGWEKVLEERKLLFASPQRASNARDSNQRCGLAVVCALKMREQYKIDPRRVYAAGYSGGGRMASRLGYYHPDLFSGTIQSCGSDFHRPVPAVKAIPLARDRRSPYGLLQASPAEIKAARQNVRFVIITGPGDFRYGHLWDIYEGGFLKDGFQARLLDDPLMDHVTCGPYPLRQALHFIERGKTP